MQLSPEQAQGLAMYLLTTIENEIPTTAKLLAAVPQDKLGFTLGDKGRPCKDLMWHIVSSDIWFADGISSGEFGKDSSDKSAETTPAQMAENYKAALTASLAKVKKMTGEQLAKPMNFFNVMNLPAVMYLGFLNNHSIHHRGQLSSYVRAMNAHVPSIYGGSADEPFQAPASA